MAKLGFASAAFAAVLAAEAVAGVVEYEEETGAFRNPGQGWSAAYKPVEAFDGVVNIGAVYDRLPWRILEPEEGKFDFSKIDAQIEHARTNGVPYYFRVMCVNEASNRRRDTPDWFFQKPGAKKHTWLGRSPYRDWTDGGRETREREAPYFDDPVFLECHGRLVRALAERYDGHPMVGAIDIGSYGNFGEWHCWPMKYPRELDEECRRKIADLYLDAFRETPLLFLSGDAATFAYACGKEPFPRVGVRLDSVGSTWHYRKWIGTPPCEAFPRFPEIWKRKPVFLEFIGGVKWFRLHETNEWYRGKQSTIAEAVDWILANHASLVNTCPVNPDDVREKDPEGYAAFRRIDLYAGARLVPRRAEVARDGLRFRVRLEGENKGVAPILLPYRAVWRFRGADGRISFERTAPLDVRGVLPGPFAVEDDFTLPETAGTAAASFAVVHAPGVLPDFRLAAKRLNAFGELPLQAAR